VQQAVFRNSGCQRRIGGKEACRAFDDRMFQRARLHGMILSEKSGQRDAWL
jgi:hypothetical protein